MAVGTICRRVDGIPLGLELAAARSRTVSLPELAELLDHSIGALASTGHGTLPRHRTMRAASTGDTSSSPPTPSRRCTR